MDRLLPWQRQLYECERLICQRDTDLSEVRGWVTFASMCTCPSPALSQEREACLALILR